ncbi:MAG: hypothetical protein RL317_823 [Pseudomonadota bacterium]|jgi:acyl-CoA dehydrogenase
MNFDFSEDQRRLQEEVARVLKDRSTSEEVRTVLDGIQPYSASCWKELADLGALGVSIPEAQGGIGLTTLELCLVAEEAGRVLLAAPLRSSIYLAAEALRRGGSPDQQAAWLPRLAIGDLIATAAINVSGQQAINAIQPRLENGRLSGVMNAVPDGMVADIALVLVDGHLALIDLHTKGVTRTSQKSIDPTCPLAQLSFNDVALDLLPCDGAAVARKAILGASVLIAFEQVGGASRALQVARDYVMERRTFGRQVGSYQAVKHKLAEIYSIIELARAHAYFGAWALATDAPELERAAAAARVAATDAYNIAAEESLHLHGGIGFTWDMDCHLHLRRARWLGQILGSAHYWRDSLTSALIKEAN